MIDQHIPPYDATRFNARLRQTCVGRQVELRCVWAPAQNVMRVINVNGEIVPCLYRKYPLIQRDTEVPILKGHKFMRAVGTKAVTSMLTGTQVVPNMIEAGYQKNGGIAPPHILPTDFCVPDYERVNPSIHVFVIEKKLDDMEARRIHARKQTLSKKHLGVDVYGEFPEEGVWDFWEDVSIHERGCCDLADELGILCHGLYREPGDIDLERARYALQKRDERPANLSLAIEQAEKDIRAGHREYRDNQLAERMREAYEIERTAIRSITKPAVYLDSKRMNNAKHP